MTPRIIGLDIYFPQYPACETGGLIDYSECIMYMRISLVKFNIYVFLERFTVFFFFFNLKISIQFVLINITDNIVFIV